MSQDDRENLVKETDELLNSVQRSIEKIKQIETGRILIEPVPVKTSENAGDVRSNVRVEIRENADAPRTPKKIGLIRRAFARVSSRVSSRVRCSILYVLTWISTTFVGTIWYGGGSVFSGLLFSAPLMLLLTFHELGHYLQSRRYGVTTSPPYFIPIPAPPLGTFGALIFMRGRIPDCRALFDIGASGPLAGLAATFLFLVLGISQSRVVPTTPELLAQGGFVFSEPLIFKWTAQVLLGYDPATQSLLMHPTALAAWVGILVTTLNLMPIGQLDGGHIFYALTKKRAKACSYALFAVAALGVVFFHLWNWSLLLVLLFFFGLRHPSTLDDSVPLGLGRTILGWATLAFIILGFSARPLDYREPEPAQNAEVVQRVDAIDCFGSSNAPIQSQK